MSPESLQKLVDAYIERFAKQYQWDKDLVLREHDVNFWAWEEFECLVDDSPDEAWQAILAVLESTSDKYILGILAAGPLEDLIDRHGTAFVEQIEQRARDDQRFQELLCGVWKSSTPGFGQGLSEPRAMNRMLDTSLQGTDDKLPPPEL
jgi:hypothetical protein